MLYQGWMQKLWSVYSEAVLQLDGSHLELVYALLNELSDHFIQIQFITCYHWRSMNLGCTHVMLLLCSSVSEQYNSRVQFGDVFPSAISDTISTCEPQPEAGGNPQKGDWRLKGGDL